MKIGLKFFIKLFALQDNYIKYLINPKTNFSRKIGKLTYEMTINLKMPDMCPFQMNPIIT